MPHPFTLHMASISRELQDSEPLLSIYDGSAMEMAGRDEVFIRIESDGTLLVVGWKSKVTEFLKTMRMTDEVAVEEFVMPDYMPSTGALPE